MAPIRILVVEDDRDFQYLIQQTLAASPDFVLTACCEGEESAYLAAVRDDPDVVLMDLAFPSNPMGGVRAARRIRLETRAKVILLTSYEDSATVIRASV